jgi:hypothetical protein
LRRIIIAATLLAALVTASGAYASTMLNTYTGSLTFHSSKPGTPAKPSPASFVELFSAMNATAGLDAAPLIDIKLKMYGMRLDWRDFPTCSLAQVTAHYGATCPAKSLVSSGPIQAILGPPSLTMQNTIACNPLLDVWNAGGGKVIELTTISPTHLCGGLQTGAAAPYVVTFSQSGNWLSQDAPLPPDVSTNAGNLGLYSSIIQNDLNWGATRRVHGKTVSYLSSIGCMHGKRPYSMTFTATNGATPQTTVINGNGAC